MSTHPKVSSRGRSACCMAEMERYRRLIRFCQLICMPLLSPHPQRTGQRLHCPPETSTVWFLSSFHLHTSRCTPSTQSKVPKRDRSLCCTPLLLSAPPRIRVRPLLISAERILASGWFALLRNCECKGPTPSIPSKWDTVRCHTPAARHRVLDRRDFPQLELPRKLSLSSGCHLRKSWCKASIRSSLSKQGTCLCCNPQPLQRVPASHTPLHCLGCTLGLSSWFRHHTSECTRSIPSTRCTPGRPLLRTIRQFPTAPNSRC